MKAPVIWAREPLPDGPAIFLAGPTPGKGGPRSWRWDAFEAIDRLIWAPGAAPFAILTPESRGARADRYEDQFRWETEARRRATVIMFWIPRDLKTMPGFTTNVEFGLDVPTGKVVLGCPRDCPNPERNRYLIHVARRFEAPVCDTLDETARAAVALLVARS